MQHKPGGQVKEMKPVLDVTVTRPYIIRRCSNGSATQVSQVYKHIGEIINVCTPAKAGVEDRSDNFVVTTIQVADRCIDAIGFKFGIKPLRMVKPAPDL